MQDQSASVAAITQLLEKTLKDTGVSTPAQVPPGVHIHITIAPDLAQALLHALLARPPR